LVVIVAIRETFVIAGISLILSAALVIAFVQESSRATRPSKGQPEPAERVDFRRTIIPMLAPLLSVQMVIMTVSSSMFPLMALRFLSLDAAHATLVTGVGFAVSGGASAISAMQASRIASAIGYRRACVLAAVGTCATLVAIVSIRSVPLAVAFYFLYGLANGLLLPLTTVLIGLQVPLQMHSTVFGLGGTAQAIGITVGPLLAGGLASFGGVSLALVVLACSSALLAAAMRKVLREPDAAGWVAAAAPTPAAPDSA
jgi:MFS family permease